jgi:hypothetical protein
MPIGFHCSKPRYLKRSVRMMERDDSSLCVPIYHREERPVWTILDDRRLTDDRPLLARLLRRYDVGLTV